MTYTKLTNAQFDEMQFNAGILVKRFDPAYPVIDDEDIICATNSGFSLAVQPIIVDLGDGVYMMPPNTAEMMLITGWTVEAEFTCIGFSPAQIAMVLGSAVRDDATITPQTELNTNDFQSVWWLGDRVDGGFVAVKLIDALSEDGFDLQTNKNEKGETSVRLVAHTSLEESDGESYSIPVEIYSVGTPKFWIQDYIYLYADGIRNDVIEVDTSTGNLNVTENGIWHYEIDEETGTMEVTYK